MSRKADSNPLPTLPAKKGLSRLAESRPVIVIDSREQEPLRFSRLPVARDTLQSGDYSFRGGEHLFAIERKTIADLVGSCTRGRARFERELHRLRGFAFKRLLIVGTREEIRAHGYRSQATPRAILASLAAFEIRYSVPVVFCPDPTAAAIQIESWVWWYSREVVEAANKLLTGCAG